jgi:hypothetical protein
MVGPNKIKDTSRWAVVDYEGNVVELHYSEKQADYAAFERMRKESYPYSAGRYRTCEVKVVEVK